MKKYDVLCPHCCGVFLETNGRFREDKPANGSMFTAKQGIVDAGWSVFPLYDTTEYDNVVCPSCSQVLLDSLGKVLRLKEIGEVDEITDTPMQEIVKKTIDELMAEYDPELPPMPQVDYNWKIVSSSLIIDVSEIEKLREESKFGDEFIRKETEKKIFETEFPSGDHSLKEELGAVNAENAGLIPADHPKKPGRPRKE